MKRLLLAGALAGAALAGTAPAANATIVVCDNMPVMVNCYSFREGKWCTVWVAALSFGCVEDALGTGTVALDVHAA